MIMALMLMALTAYELRQRSIEWPTATAMTARELFGNGGSSSSSSSTSTSGSEDGGWSEETRCRVESGMEYSGEVLVSGADNHAGSAAECCNQCANTPRCNVWVWCAWMHDCSPDHKYRECWLKITTLNMMSDQEGFNDPGVGWTSGSLFTSSERFELIDTDRRRLADLRNDASLPLVFLDVAIHGYLLGRVEIVLFTDTSPLAAENFRAMCTGEKGMALLGPGQTVGSAYHLKGAAFYRIVDRFIVQSGTPTDSTYGGAFKDDPGGLALKHNRKGLLSMDNDGKRDTNTAHWAIMMATASHFDGHYVVFGEVVRGFEYIKRINQLAIGAPDNAVDATAEAMILDSGQLR
ncbi:hypothetical protein FOA52_016284 [Chlamydomonas sp. UWO 241]|nr:hypothetical protein FOA52_016284 [Chlamydomonas sp. UWO 241]